MNFQEWLDNYVLWLTKSCGYSVPQNIRLWEVDWQKYRTKEPFRIEQDELKTPEEYSTRFEELRQMHLHWMNLSCWGVQDGCLLIGVELPGDMAKVKTTKPTPVHFCGAPNKIPRDTLNSEHVLIIDRD